MRTPRALLLDLDGTLIDSAPDIADALNATLARFGREALPTARVRSMIGNGIAALVGTALEATGGLPEPPLQDLALAEMTRRYGADPVARTLLLPGAGALLSTCRHLDVAVACVTNKPVRMARAILAHFGLLGDVALVIGGDEGLARKPAPDGLLAAAAFLGVSRRAAWKVGDSMMDVQAARAAGMRVIAVKSDYGAVPVSPADVDVFVDSLDDLVAMLCDGAPAP
jgi:phosphoglycolate phosphatase